ncbi:chromate resistance protein ChrB domain-containing protein [Mucilaginibacter sp. L3T2-6]|uniref:chromate resistance protein ChrB domain-containing protein n=1 Tax=Mucilaginibacter sp. L3T2-6 TaxID=3062491 RepID=UPI002676E442|nr:chromate resistance protein ChrB domain-containing protein [Mucilaginibacter sp. L3T2-6]MDO3643724.1 chromate resistance protein [Mucilaginibacter sp. L3T2-6]MDV6216175.1 chromate resistance protein [Mucilaginibacter sp. L3T2-6]
MKWITREHPKIDRIACPWLIKRFIDPNAEIIYVPFAEVLTKAKELDATPFDLPGVEYTHYEDQCSFDYFIKKHQLKDEALYRIAAIVRGADTDRHDFAPQAAGLEAIFSGLAYNIKDDHELLELGMTVYDGLYSWAKHLHQLKHTQGGPVEQMLLEVYHKYLKDNSRKAPAWTKELKEMIQDQLDTNMSLSLQQLSHDLEINPSYLSREFSKYFDNLSFGDYIRKLRIEKATNLLEKTNYSLTEIAYLTGFSDQSHFNRIFKKQMGMTASEYRKTLQKK